MNISDIKRYEGRGNELVSLYAAPSNSISNIEGIIDRGLESLEDYDEGTRMKYSVRDTLNRMKEEILDLEKIPKNGIIIFAGRVEGDTMCRVFSDELQSRVKNTRYITGSQFSTQKAEQIISIAEPQLIVVLDTGNMIMGYNKNGAVTVIDEFRSNIPSKHSKGGQSQSRFERRRRECRKEFFNNCKERIRKRIPKDNTVFIGGPEITVKQFINATQIDNLANIVISSTSYVNKSGLQTVSKVATKHKNKKRMSHKKENIDKFMQTIKNNPSLAEYGTESVKKAISYGAVDKLIVHEDDYEATIEDAKSKGASIVTVGKESDKERMFLEAFDGIGAILNYQID